MCPPQVEPFTMGNSGGGTPARQRRGTGRVSDSTTGIAIELANHAAKRTRQVGAGAGRLDRSIPCIRVAAAVRLPGQVILPAAAGDRDEICEAGPGGYDRSGSG